MLHTFDSLDRYIPHIHFKWGWGGNQLSHFFRIAVFVSKKENQNITVLNFVQPVKTNLCQSVKY
jgi:hypothetical protein